MLATFVIGLREGLEAALIVGIVASFLRKNGTLEHLRQMWLGVAGAVLICLLVGIVLGHTNLPQRQQEMLETVVGAVAVVMVTFMVMWMKGHSRNLKKELEVSAQAALDRGSATALVLTAFLAVVREGFETAVFLVASFQSTRSVPLILGGAVLGIAVAVVLGYAIYRGGVRINLSRFFRITGVVLVVVAAGLVMTVFNHAHEADWINVGQQQAIDLSAFVRPGSVQASLVTGVLGIQAQPTWIEVIAWLLYLVPMLAVVLWPAKRMLTRRSAGRLLALAGVAALVIAGVLALFVPRPSATTRATVAVAGPGAQGSVQLVVLDRRAGAVTLQLVGSAAGSRLSAPVELVISGAETIGNISGVSYTGGAVPATIDAGAASTTVTGRELAALNGGRLPIGLNSTDLNKALPVKYTETWQPTVVLAGTDGGPLALDLRVVRTATVTGGSAGLVVTAKVQDVSLATDPASSAGLSRSAADAVAQHNRAEILGQVLPGLLAGAGLISVLLGLPRLVRSRRTVSVLPTPVVPAETPVDARTSAPPVPVGARTMR